MTGSDGVCRKACVMSCSYPVPDKYSVTLEISRDRTTAVKQAPCDQTQSTSALCTSDLLDTGPATYPVYRAVNEPCTKLVGSLSIQCNAASSSSTISSSAVAKRPRDASCLSVVSFNSGFTIPPAHFLSRVSTLTRDIDIALLTVRLSVTFRD